MAVLRRWSLEDKRRYVATFEADGLDAVVDLYDLRRSTATQYVTQFRADIKRYDAGHAQLVHRDTTGYEAVPAYRAPNLERVPESAQRLPWVGYPRSVAAQTELLKLLEDARAVGAEHAASAEALKSLDSQIAYVRALIARAASVAA